MSQHDLIVPSRVLIANNTEPLGDHWTMHRTLEKGALWRFNGLNGKPNGVIDGEPMKKTFPMPCFPLLHFDIVSCQANDDSKHDCKLDVRDTVSPHRGVLISRLRYSLTHWGRDNFRLIFHWSLFLMLELMFFQYWYRKWLGADRRMYASLGLNELNFFCLPTAN